ncbi:siderophore-interacting protein [Nakamurella sp.]|uniref:siderophore-interacting protein n=1 Tax=Nakamurella sp. TaxID=1869182 RepID=UPI003B3ABB79
MTASTIPPATRRPVPAPVTVVRTTRLTPTLVRVVFGGLTGFAPSRFTDSYVKLIFPRAPYPQPLDLDRIRQEWPVEQWPVVRTYTVRAFDPVAHELTVDFVVHGSTGVAGPWAASARPGDTLFVRGPGGAYAPDPDADWHLLAGDESALPAIAVALESLPADARGHAVVEVSGPASQVPLTAPAGVTITWLHSGHRTVGERLVEVVRGIELPLADVQAFVHGEAGWVAQLRRLLRVDRQVPAARLSISGYWRLGNDEEGWRAGKAQWAAAAEEIERRAGVA